MSAPKARQFRADNQSLKFHLMAELTTAPETKDVEVGAWTPEQMQRHGDRMLAVLRRWQEAVAVQPREVSPPSLDAV